MCIRDSIYRYPNRFQADRADAFRGWGHRIARNTLYKCLKSQARHGTQTPIDDEPFHPEDVGLRQPDRAASEAESARTVNGAFVLYLHLYLQHFERLSEREQRALTMVEVERRSYKEAAAELGIRVENLKMVVFRGRRKIFRGMEQSLLELRVRGAAEASSGGPVGGRCRAEGRGVAARHGAAARHVLTPAPTRLPATPQAQAENPV